MRPELLPQVIRPAAPDRALEKAFRLAGARVWDGVSRVGQEFICHALDQLEQEGQISEGTCNAAQKVIERALDGCSTLFTWITVDPTVPSSEWPNRAEMQALRKAWCQALAAAYEGA